MSQYTLQIIVNNAAPLDGTTFLDINGPGVTVDKSSNRTIIVNMDAALAFGRLNLGQVVQDQIPQLAGRPLILAAFTAVSAVAYPAAGNTLARVTPTVVAQEAVQQIVNLGDAPIQGMLFGQPEIFPFEHHVAVTTTVAGPHRLVFVIKDLDDDAVSAWGCCVEECDCPTGPAGPTGPTGPSGGGCCPPQVLDPDFPVAGMSSVVISLPGCDFDEPMTAEVRIDSRGVGQVGLPTVNSVTVTPGVSPNPDVVNVDLDTSTASGDFMLILVNECGCCTVAPFTVQPA